MWTQPDDARQLGRAARTGMVLCLSVYTCVFVFIHIHPTTLFCRCSWASVFEAHTFKVVGRTIASAWKTAQKPAKNADFQKIKCVRPLIVGKSALWRAFAPFPARLQTLGTQLIIRVPQESGPRNSGKMASKPELRNFGT